MQMAQGPQQDSPEELQEPLTPEDLEALDEPMQKGLTDDPDTKLERL